MLGKRGLTGVFTRVSFSATRVYRGGGWQRSHIIAGRPAVVNNYVSGWSDVLGFRLAHDNTKGGLHEKEE